MFWGVEVGKAEGILIIFIVNMSRSRDHLSIVYHKVFIHHNANQCQAQLQPFQRVNYSYRFRFKRK